METQQRLPVSALVYITAVCLAGSAGACLIVRDWKPQLSAPLLLYFLIAVARLRFAVSLPA